jgi:hypothetical protein
MLVKPRVGTRLKPWVYMRLDRRLSRMDTSIRNRVTKFKEHYQVGAKFKFLFSKLVHEAGFVIIKVRNKVLLKSQNLIKLVRTEVGTWLKLLINIRLVE